jgi:hypothetical protein
MIVLAALSREMKTSAEASCIFSMSCAPLIPGDFTPLCRSCRTPFAAHFNKHLANPDFGAHPDLCPA